MQMVGHVPDSVAMILCCECGCRIEPNPANMCIGCIRGRVDITEGIPKQSVLHFCRNCERYLQPPAQWVSCALESRELLALCLKKIKGLSAVRLVDASFMWTEPHSKRIKVKLAIQKEVFASTILQQEFIVDFVVQNQMCDACHRREADDFWKAVVQVRQKAKHKKTFFYLEQLLLKHQAHANTLKIKQCKDGLDFFFGSRSDAKKLVDFLQSVVPIRSKTSEQLISHDIHNSTSNYKFTFSVEIVPICKDDILCLPRPLAQAIGSISPLVLCYRVSTTLQVVDPCTLQVAEISGAAFWRHPFTPVTQSRSLTEFTVMEISPLDVSGSHVRTAASAGRGVAQRFCLAEMWLVRSDELGVSDRQYYSRTHLGHLLSEGDTVMGFDFVNTNVNHDNLDKLRKDLIPDVLVVKKHYGDKHKRHAKRNWRLKALKTDDTESMDTSSSNDRDYTDFLEDLEEDPVIRQHVNIYHDPHRQADAMDMGSDTVVDGAPQISLAEMLEDLSLQDDDAAGAVMQ